MSGKTGQRQSTPHTATTGRGGARPGSGRPRNPEPVEDSSTFRTDLCRALAEKAEATGKTVSDLLVDVAYGRDKAQKMRALQLIFATMVPKESTRVVEQKRFPRSDAGLPPLQPDPALKMLN